MKKEIASNIRAILHSPNQEEADRLLQKTIKKYQEPAPELAAWMERSIPEWLTIMQFPEAYRRWLRTSNVAERVNREFKRRTRLVGIFSSMESCLRLVSALAVEIDEERQTGKPYIGIGEEN